VKEFDLDRVVWLSRGRIDRGIIEGVHIGDDRAFGKSPYAGDGSRPGHSYRIFGGDRGRDREFTGGVSTRHCEAR